MKPPTSSAQTEATALGHVYICNACAARVGLRESFLMIIYERPCEGCGTPVGYASVLRPIEVVGEGIRQMRVPTKLVANCMQMWRNKMWPVAFGIAVQDFGGAHVHEWNPGYWAAEHDGKKNFAREHCRCGEKRERWEQPT